MFKMNSSFRRRALISIRVVLLLAAILALRNELKGIHLHDVAHTLQQYKAVQLSLVLVLVVASFLALCVVELLGIRYAGSDARAKIPVPTAMRTSFVATAFSQAIGFAVLTGTAVRTRAYARRGVSAADIGRISGFVTVTATLGLLTGAAVSLLIARAPFRIGSVEMPSRTAGVLLALPVLAYLAWTTTTRDELHIGTFALRRPSSSFAIFQIAMSVADLLVTSAVLYVLIASIEPLSLVMFVRAYLVAQAVAVISHVPAGVGIFEAGMLTLLASSGGHVHAVQLTAAMLMFRIAYYLIPLLGALILA